MAAGRDYEVQTLGAFAPFPRDQPELGPGRGRIHRRGASRTWPTPGWATPSPTPARPTDSPLPGFQPAKPMVFAGIFPTDSAKYEDLRDALDKLRLNDASFTREPESSAALGFGFRCGFLGLLHMEIVQERLEREYNLELITTAPTVRFRLVHDNGEVERAGQPGQVRQRRRASDQVEEPVIAATIHTPPEYVGALLKLCEDKRGVQTNLSYAGERRVIIRYDLPLTEVVYGFYDRMKSVSRGLCLAGLRAQGLPGRRPGPPGSAGQRRTGRLTFRSSSTGRPPSTRAGTCATR